MAFKKVTDYNQERYGGFFMLRDDMDYADVVFLYQSIDDVLVADVHYIKSNDYSGYVHCCGPNCPACKAGIRVQNKLFIPLYNIQANEIQFFDRSVRFDSQLQSEVFSKYPNPSEYVFRITRRGAAGDVNTTYSIVAIARNTGPNSIGSYDQILAKFNTKMPDKYEDVCRSLTVTQLSDMLNNNTSAPADVPAAQFEIKPRETVEPAVEDRPLVNLSEFTADHFERKDDVKFPELDDAEIRF